MTTPPLPPMTKPQLTLRVGVTGTRELSAAQEVLLRRAIARVLDLLQEQIGVLSRISDAIEVYELDPAGRVIIGFQAVSALAEGADRVFADAAVASGYSLLAPLPFKQTEYEQDFPMTGEEFRALLAHARVVELDGSREDAPASYEAVGHFIVRNADILIAIWDGQPGRGLGGTADVVRFAAHSDLPVWWINAHSGVSRLITRQSHWRHLESALREQEAEGELAHYLQGIILPPAAPHPHRSGLIGQAAQVLSRVFRRDQRPLALYLGEKMPEGGGGGPSFLASFYGAWARRPWHPSSMVLPAETPAEIFWERHYNRADALSIVYGNLYRSSYISVIFLALIAFISAIAGRLVLSEWMQSATELGILLVIGWLVWRNNLLNWQERWISYRLLAELCRKQIMLAPLARTLPGLDIKRLAIDAGLPSESKELPREGWISWYFMALMRSAPLPQYGIEIGKRRAFALAKSIVTEQIDYHNERRIRAKRIDHLLLSVGDGLFFLTLLLLTISLVVITNRGHVEALNWLEELALGFSAFSAALVSLKAYAEFALLARQSQRMESLLTVMSAELDELNIDLPLSSRELGSTLHRLALSMMQEVGGWAQLFRLKAVENH